MRITFANPAAVAATPSPAPVSAPVPLAFDRLAFEAQLAWRMIAQGATFFLCNNALSGAGVAAINAGQEARFTYLQATIG